MLTLWDIQALRWGLRLTFLGTNISFSQGTFESMIFRIPKSWKSIFWGPSNSSYLSNIALATLFHDLFGESRRALVFCFGRIVFVSFCRSLVVGTWIFVWGAWKCFFLVSNFGCNFFLGGVLFYPSFQLQIAPRINKDGCMLPIAPWLLGNKKGPEAPMNRHCFPVMSI